MYDDHADEDRDDGMTEADLAAYYADMEDAPYDLPTVEDVLDMAVRLGLDGVPF